MNLRPSLLLLFFLFAGLLPEAGAQYQAYGYQRALQGIDGQWHTVPLPNPLYGRLQTHDQADIRIIGLLEAGDTVEAPYLWQRHEREVVQQRIPFTLLNQSRSAGGYQYTFKLPDNKAVNQLHLELEKDNFDWLTRLEGSHDQRQWQLLEEDQRILALKNEQANYRFTTLYFPKTNYPYLRLTIRSAESPKLLEATLSELDTLPGRYQQYSPAHFAVRQAKKEKQTVVEFSLPQQVPVSGIRLQVADSMAYYRPLQIQYLADSVQTTKGWQYQYRTLAKTWLSSLEGAEFSFPTILAKSFRLVVEDQDNTPLTIRSATVSSPEWNLVARFAKPGRYYLIYGHAGARPPRYDLAWFKDNIPEAPKALQLGDETVKATDKALAEPLFKHKGWLWGVMGVIILLLGWASLHMLRKG